MDQTEKKGMSPLLIAGIVAVLAIAGIGVMMSRGSTTTQQVPSENQAMTQTDAQTSELADESISAMDEVQIVEVEAGSFYFKPNEIRVKKGQKVKIVMKSVSMMHDFVIDELDVSMPVVQDGDMGEVEFTATEAGEFEYYCSVGEHRANGQVGKLIVE